MNGLAAETYRSTMTNYPVGSVVVKEKLLLLNNLVSSNALGGMVKRAPGYDPRNGDWEYFYFENGHPVERSRLDGCRSCHRSAGAVNPQPAYFKGTKGKDHVFGAWGEDMDLR